jgi:hypothetical protein
VSFVSFVLPLRAGEKIKIGGFALKTLKKLKGAKLSFHLHQLWMQKQLGADLQLLIDNDEALALVFPLGQLLTFFFFLITKVR